MNTTECFLTDKKCVPCEGRMLPLNEEQIKPLLQEVQNWQVIDGKKVQRSFKFKNFVQALGFVNKVGEIAEKEGHHPDINLHGWNKVTIRLSTHAIKGLSENDFIMAAKIDQVNN